MTVNVILSALLSIAFGLMMSFWGYLLFRKVLTLFGGLFGALLLAMIIANQEHSATWIILGGVMGALTGIVAVNVIYGFGVFWIGGAWGSILLTSFALALNVTNPLLLSGAALIGLLAGGMTALLYEKLMIMITTAFVGAAALATGSAALITGNPDWLYEPLTEAGNGMLIVFACWLIIGLMGVVFQWRTLPDMVGAETI